MQNILGMTWVWKNVRDQVGDTWEALHIAGKRD